jgi:[ribosomal protein S18]-alanine N-acetyltransferase
MNSSSDTKNTEIQIRKALIGDMDAICSIEAECFPNPWSYGNFRNEFDISFSTIYLAEIGTEPIAYASLWAVGDEIQLNRIAVLEKYRKNGIGRSIVQRICSDLSNIGSKEIFIEVREKNGPAIEFYKKLGFTRIGFRKNYYSDDNAVLMKKEL